MVLAYLFVFIVYFITEPTLDVDLWLFRRSQKPCGSASWARGNSCTNFNHVLLMRKCHILVWWPFSSIWKKLLNMICELNFTDRKIMGEEFFLNKIN